jgi:hypothetical protein
MSLGARKEYSSTLLEYGGSRRTIAVYPLAFGETGVKQRVKNILNYKKPAFWIIIVALLTCFIVAACFLTNPNSNSTLTKYEQSGQKLSELSEDKCLAFIASCGLAIPDELNTKNVGSLVKEIITFSEKYPQSPAGYSYTVTMDFAENIRKAVNEYYGIDGGNYLFAPYNK